MANSTAATIIGYAWKILKVESTVITPGLQTEMMLNVLNKGNMEWLRTFRRGGEPPIARRAETGYGLIAATALASDQATTDVTAVLDDSTSFSASGAIVVVNNEMSDIQEYTSNAANTLSGVTGIDFAHSDGERVVQLYPLPANFHSFRTNEKARFGILVNGVPYDFSSAVPEGLRFSVYDNGTTKYLWFPVGLTGDCTVVYNKSTTTIDDTTDIVDVPPEYEDFLVHRLAEHGRRVRGDNVDRIQDERNRADLILREAMRERNFGKGVRTRPLGLNRVNSIYYPGITDRE